MLPVNKVIITVAVNGGMQQDRDGAVVPKHAEGIGEAAANCYEAGASVVHFHARDPRGNNSADPDAERLGLLGIEPQQDLLGIAGGSAASTTPRADTRRKPRTSTHGRDMFKIVTLGLSLGCDLVRVGLGDSIHLRMGG